ncbi:MAG: hypothetical protein JW708_07500 [Vallitaleaceae bacterium]|nr:hypothetical protein [Vallitaleaceae bacterium]
MKEEILKQYERLRNRKLAAAIAIDLIGFFINFIPVLGGISDAIWAPMSGFLIFLLFPNRKGMALFGVAEEIMPFTDIVPTAIMTWRKEYVKYSSQTLADFVRSKVDEEVVVEQILRSRQASRIITSSSEEDK